MRMIKCCGDRDADIWLIFKMRAGGIGARWEGCA